MKNFIGQITDTGRLLRHLRTALFIGLILNMINQWRQLINLDFVSIDYIKIVLTFFVPFAVSVYSSAKAADERLTD